jgi:hypothetical protein
MTPAERPPLERRVLAALEALPPRIPVMLGGCGTGRTSLLLRLREHLGRGACQYIDVERCATTPERFFRTVVQASPFAPADGGAFGGGGAGSARAAFEATTGFFDGARGPGGVPATFLLDEALELRTFESFPGLRSVLRDLLQGLATSQNRFVLTTRYMTRAHRLLRDAPARFEAVTVAPLGAPEIVGTLNGLAPLVGQDREEIARGIAALSAGRPVYARAMAETVAEMTQRGGGDVISALAALMAPEASLAAGCRFCYELRLHRARGYGALKAILDVLAEEEPLTLTEIAQRLSRTPGSTKDYLSWLEDVDLISVERKRYRFSDPLLRLWVRLYCRSVPPSEEDLAREVHTYAIGRLPRPEPALALAGPPGEEGRKPWGIIEID